jgi:hypothetical protein
MKARTKELMAERARAAAEGRPYAIVEECDLRWSIGAPLPTVLQWGNEAHLFFYLRESDRDGSGDQVGSIAFEQCRATRLDPWGEDGHRLSGSGWEPYTALRVINSCWLQQTFDTSSDLAHFVFPFHDETFECIARSFKASRLEGSMADAIRATIDRWN